MTPTQINKSLFMAALLVGSTTFADTRISELDQWSLWETTTSDNRVECYLQTEDKGVFRTEDYLLEIHKIKNSPNSPVEVLMRIDRNKKGTTGLIANVTYANSTMSFADMNDRKERFWGIGKNLSLLTAQFTRNQQQLPIKAKGGSQEIDVKLRGDGFYEMMLEMEKRCNMGENLVNLNFEDEMLSSVKDNIDPTRISSAVVTQLRSLYFSSYGTYMQMASVKDQWEVVLAPYQPILTELNANRTRASEISNQALPASQKTLAEAKKQQVDSKAEIVKIDSALPGLISRVDASQRSYDSARAILAPLEPEYNRINSNIDSSEQSLSQAQSRLSSVDSRLQDLARQIYNLQSEVQSLERQLPQKRNDLDRAISILRDAEYQRSQYNVSYERDRRLNSNGEYNRMVSEKSSVDGSLSQAQSELNQVSSERNRIANDLNQCRASATTIIAVDQSAQITEPPTDGGGVPPMIAAPPVLLADCSQLEQALATADSAVNQKQSEVQNLSSRQNQLASAISSVQRQVDSEVRSTYDALVSRENQARRTQQGLEDDVRRDDNRISQIRLSDLPRQQQEQSQLSNERPSVVAQIGQANADIDRLNRELSQFKARSDWDKKLASVNAKASQLSLDQTNLSNAQSQKSAAQVRIEKSAATEVIMTKQIAALSSELSALNQRAIALQQGLQDLPAKRAPYDSKIAALQSEVTAKKTDFLNLLR